MRMLLTTLLLIAAMSFTGCGQSTPAAKSADSKIQAQQEMMMKEAVSQTGLPAIHNFKEKKMMKMLYELRDQEGLVCHAYLMNEMNGKIGQYLGQCIGYGLPASTQYSNPEKIAVNKTWKSSTYGAGGIYGTLPQAEPNGLFMPEGL